ncbi:zinc/manganese transport system substrate-binding protein [Herbihabitans rhizosphaerae]|uniref:Zinc/manganese transport system substrate-binding protein n=1 Tax=Herbihabitans rhizosphaerae TaxID=1872711 RepID=A0A4Q7KZL6_9PSEU|nr:zinc ABC transporter substrate-binding protein [Herbihabitans rhizosphaerae]RZS41162.1 zinc/manganese transport system substrate-binding protein [Herbihabitans rhizosphaerae]
MTSRLLRSVAKATAGFAALALGLSGCGGGDGAQPPPSSQPPTSAAANAQPTAVPVPNGPKIDVVASTNVWGSVLQAVGGDAVAVKSIISDPSADPHSYEGTPADGTAIRAAKLAVFNGGGYDEFFTKLAGAPGITTAKIDAFALSGKQAGKPGGHGHGDHEHGEVNEHVWYDLPTVKKVSAEVAKQLAVISPDRKAAFDANAAAFAAKLDGLTAKITAIAKERPGTKIVSTEAVAQYLIEAAGLEDATPEDYKHAIEEETDPPAAAINKVTTMIRGKQVAALINNSQTETPATKRLVDAANGAGVGVVGVTETLPAGVTDYVDWMTKQVDALAGALAKK